MTAAAAPLFVLSGPSGTGKSTVLRRLLAEPGAPLRLSISATTRQPRKGETDGVQYYFWDRARFEAQIAVGAFLEWAEVFGRYYGTLRAEVDPYRRQGIGVFLDIDVQGAAQIRVTCPDAVTIFLRAPSLEAYEERLRRRGTESEVDIQRRLAGARQELERIGEYQFVVVNDELDSAVAQLRSIVLGYFAGS